MAAELHYDYLVLYKNSELARHDPAGLLALGALVMCRLLPIVALSPFFGARVLPHPVKMAFSLCLGVIFLPQLLTIVKGPLPFNDQLILLGVKELFIGTILGFFLSLPFLVVSSAGVLIDHQRGASSLMTNDPTIQNQSSPIGTLYNMLLLCLFFYYDGPFYVIDIISNSWEVMPPDTLLNDKFFSYHAPVHQRIIHILINFVTLTIQLATPGLLATLMVDTFLGIINRLAPQVQITFLGMGLKSWLVLFILFAGWTPFIDEMGKQIIRFLIDFQALVLTFNSASLPT